MIHLELQIKCEEDTKNITLHADLNLVVNDLRTSLRELTVDGNRSIPIEKAYGVTKHSFFIVKPTETLQKGRQYELYLVFRGERHYGYYKSSYVDRNTKLKS